MRPVPGGFKLRHDKEKLIPLYLSLILAILSTFTFSAFVWWIDLWEREPFSEAAARILYGGLPAVIYVSVLGTALWLLPLPRAVVQAPLVEEAAKGLGVLFVFSSVYRRRFDREGTADSNRKWKLPADFVIDLLGKNSNGEREMDTPLDGLIYGALVGFGFALTENIFYYGGFEGGPEFLLRFVFLRSVVLGFSHALFSGMLGLGIGIGRHRQGPGKILFPLGGYLAAVLMHGAYNYFALQQGLGVMVLYVYLLAGMGITLTILIIQERAWIKAELEDEVDRGVLEKPGVNLAVDFGYRLLVDLNCLGKDRAAWLPKYRYLQACAELALKKRRLRAGQTREVGYRELEDLRNRVYHLREHMGDDLSSNGG